MNALNCAGASRPPLSRRSLKSTITCGLDPTCSTAEKKKKNRGTARNDKYKKFQYDPFTYGSTAMARDLLRGFIFNRKDSLTTGERDYLEDLAEDGEENDLNKAMIVLSDEDLFFNPCRGELDKSGSTSAADSSLFEGAQLSGELSSLNFSKDQDCEKSTYEDEFSSYNGDTFAVEDRDPFNYSNNMNEKKDLEDNVEIIESVNGAIILQDLKVQTDRHAEKLNYANKFDSPKHSINNMKFVTPSETKQRSRSVPHSMPTKLGTSYRLKRVAERKESAVHSNMWKAHKQGLSLTLNASSHSLMDMSRNSSRVKQKLFNGKINRSFSPFVGGHRRNVTSRGNSNRRSSQANSSRGSISSNQLGDFRSSTTNQSLSFNNSVASLISDSTDFTSIGAIKEGTGMGSRKSSTSTLGSIRDQADIDPNDYSSAGGFAPRSRRFYQDFFNSSQRSISALDLATNDPDPSFIFPESMLSGPRQDISSQESPSKIFSEPHRGDSMTSFSSLHHGLPLGDSVTSFASSHQPHPLRQTSDGSIPSLQPASALWRESSITSTDSSVTLNSLGQSYILKKEISNQANIPEGPDTSPRYKRREMSNQSHSPEEPDTSPRHKAPMRPSRNPSPLVRPKAVQRAKSDGVLPPKQSRLNSASTKGLHVVPSLHLHKRWTKMHVKKRSVDGRVDMLDTIISQDSFVQKFSEDEQRVIKPVWSSPLTNESEEEEVPTSRPGTIRTILEVDNHGSGFEEAIDNKFRAAESMREKFDAMRKYKSIMSSFTMNSSLDDSFLNTVRGWQEMRQSLSQDEISILREKMDANSSENHESPLDENDDDLSLNANDGKQFEQFDVWKVLNDDFDGHDFGFAFTILGTSADDIASTPHVLSPPLMESIYHFLPYSVSEQNYFMKYSLLRDGASFITLLQNVRGSQHTILALETTEGEVFGSFTSAQWRKNKGYFGSGEAFLWKMKGDRKTLCKSVIDQARLESDIEVYAWTGDNYMTQLCTHEMIALGGGSSSGKEGAFGLVIESDLLNGYSSHSSTFGNSPLSNEGKDGSSFEIVNLEVWTMTPCNNIEEAEKLEMARLFLERHRLEEN